MGRRWFVIIIIIFRVMIFPFGGTPLYSSSTVLSPCGYHMVITKSIPPIYHDEIRPAFIGFVSYYPSRNALPCFIFPIRNLNRKRFACYKTILKKKNHLRFKKLQAEQRNLRSRKIIKHNFVNQSFTDVFHI